MVANCATQVLLNQTRSGFRLKFDSKVSHHLIIEYSLKDHLILDFVNSISMYFY